MKVGGKKALWGGGPGLWDFGCRVSGPRMGQAGQNHRLQVSKLLAKRPERKAGAGLRIWERHTRTRASVRLVHTAISSRVLMSG